jgi:L-threonylcarbamoyladenylate synthase
MVLVDRFRPHPLYDNKRIGILSFRHYYREISYAHQFVLSVKGDLREAAKNIYRGLHQLDDLHLDLIVAERLPGIGLGLAINDRLARAAQQPEDGGLLVAQV